MRAAVLSVPASIHNQPLQIEEVEVPTPNKHEALLKVLACGVCHTDLHIVEGDLQPQLPRVTPGHQIVGEIVQCADGSFRVGEVVGAFWLGGTDGVCRYCMRGEENLCDHPVYTGYSRQGGFAQYVTAETGFLIPLPMNLRPEQAAPLLCAGIIGYRSLRIAEVSSGQRVGVFGFGASAQLVMPVLRHWNCNVYVCTREASHRELAMSMGAIWAGDAFDLPPEPLDCAISFAPVGSVAIAALRSLAKGGILAINAIHLDRMPEFDYDSLLWGERQIRSVSNMTRQDAREYLKLADEIPICPKVKTFPLSSVNEALAKIRSGDFLFPGVVIP